MLRRGSVIIAHSSTVQMQTAVTAYFSSKQLLPFAFAGHTCSRQARCFVNTRFVEFYMYRNHSAKSRRSPCAGLMLGQRRRRWLNSWRSIFLEGHCIRLFFVLNGLQLSRNKGSFKPGRKSHGKGTCGHQPSVFLLNLIFLVDISLAI